MGDNFDPKMAHLIGQTAKRTKADFDPSRCWLVKIGLTNEQYYIADEADGGKFGPAEVMGAVCLKFFDLYKEVNTEVQHIPVLVAFSLGYTMEYVKKPDWWATRPSQKSKIASIAG